MTAGVNQQYLKILCSGDQVYNLFLMLERWSFSFTLSEKENIFSTIQQIKICFFIPKCYRSYPGSCCWSHLGRGWGKQIDNLTRWKQSHNFTNFFARFHETGGKFCKAKKYTTHDSTVHKENELLIIQMFLHHDDHHEWKKVKSTLGCGSYWWCLCWTRHLYEEPFSRWIKQVSMLTIVVMHILQRWYIP